MGLQGYLTRTAAVAAARSVHRSVSASPKEVARRSRVDPDWRRTEDGYAARLGPRDTIAMSHPVGHWRHVDPRRPNPNRGLIWKAAGLGLWGGVVGAAWWLGSSRARGPLASVAELDRLGEALSEAVDGFEEI